jgi:hypothetical protein
MNTDLHLRKLTTLTAAAALGIGVLFQAPLSFAQATPSPAPSAPPSAAPSAPAPESATPSAPAPAARGRHSDAAVEARLKRLHDQLKITAAQEDQWKNLAQVIRDNEQQISTLLQQRRQKAKSMTAVDNLQSYAEITQAHAEGMAKLVPAFEQLYDQMPDAQKKVADNVFNQRVRAHTATHPTHTKHSNGTKPSNG